MQATYSELYISAATESGGIVFDGSEGTVYGDVALQEDLTIGADETLTIPATASLTIPSGVTLTNNGTVTNGGTLTNSGTIDNYGNVTGNGITGTPINHKVTDVSLDKTSLALDVGGTAQLTATVQPEEATNKNVTWTSGAPTVATVDNTGKVTAHSAGTAAITVTTADGAHTAQCTVTVTAPVTPEEPVTPPSDDSEPTYSPSLDVGDGGTVQVNPRTPEAGEEVTLTVTPDEGYAVEEVSVTDRDGDEVEVTDNGDGTYTFEQPRGRVTIEVTFRETVPAMPFADVPEDHWARDAIAWAYENGYVSGTSAAAFSPGASISRQQVWMILARLSGGAPADMAAARAWAVESGISDGTAPGGAVTRQQLAALLFR
ncbi:MAG TPA: Ig-like domain-containing protein, partial [Candidatus Oscillibacter excrementavium]|nr:Ig-like domain-containing protein [Candidatus Oscillibacter excrementavium]